VTASERLAGYVALGGLGLLAALALGRPEPAALGVAFLAAALAALTLGRPPWLEVTATLAPSQVVEGDELRLKLVVTARSEVPWLEVEVPLPEAVRPREDAPSAWRLRAGERRQLVRHLVASRWGVVTLRRLQIRSRDPLGFFVYRSDLECDLLTRVYPSEEQLLRTLRPAETQVFSGNEVARALGDGIEFADVREFQPGDRIRRINWRLSARRRGLFVNQLHPERNADVVIFLDSFNDLGGSERTLQIAVRAAASLARHYLARRDRVGLVSFGGILRWLVPAAGSIQQYQLVEALLDTQVALSYAWKGVEVIPPRTLPPRALVIGLSPLLDQRSVAALFDLRGRGFDLALIEIPAERFISPPPTPAGALAFRIWTLERDTLRHRFAQIGVPVARWEGEPLAAALEELARFRRYGPVLRA
jgi:uncharacterized protein (DUF58 family)